MLSLNSAVSNTLVARSLQSRTTKVIGGLLLLTSLTNVASATDPKTVADNILGAAIPALQTQMASMSQGCSGGSNGLPPVNWGALQVHGNAAVNAWSQARTALATGQTPVAVQLINSGLSELDVLVNGLHLSCSGGSNGEDPVYYGRYMAFRDNLKTELQTVVQFL